MPASWAGRGPGSARRSTTGLCGAGWRCCGRGWGGALGGAADRLERRGRGQMAEIKADEIASVLRQQIEGFEGGVDVSEEGAVISVGDGIARVYGLENCMAGELLQLPHGVMGMALNL